VIKVDLREIGWGGVEWIHLVQDTDCWRAVVNAVMNVWVLAPQSELSGVFYYISHAQGEIMTFY
jgi:hypothetical protein